MPIFHRLVFKCDQCSRTEEHLVEMQRRFVGAYPKGWEWRGFFKPAILCPECSEKDKRAP